MGNAVTRARRPARAHTKRSLALADHIYLESRLRSKTLRAGIQTDGASLSPRIESYPHLMVWDLFTPEYNCPDHKSRMGKIGDGGKWVCGQPSARPPRPHGLGGRARAVRAEWMRRGCGCVDTHCTCAAGSEKECHRAVGPIIP